MDRVEQLKLLAERLYPECTYQIKKDIVVRCESRLCSEREFTGLSDNNSVKIELEFGIATDYVRNSAEEIYSWTACGESPKDRLVDICDSGKTPKEARLNAALAQMESER